MNFQVSPTIVGVLGQPYASSWSVVRILLLVGRTTRKFNDRADPLPAPAPLLNWVPAEVVVIRPCVDRSAARHAHLSGHATTSTRNAIAGVGTRESGDKTPYKTHQGAFVPSGPATGWYVQVGAPGVLVGAGFYEADSPRLAAIRAAIADDRQGPQLHRLLSRLQKQGWELGGETLRTSPRGYDADHPRIELLRHTSMTLCRSYGFDR